MLSIHIPDHQERTNFAAELKKLLQNCGCKVNDYTPTNDISDIGIETDKIDSKILGKVIAQIERRGYDLIEQKGPEDLSLSSSRPNTTLNQKTTKGN